MVRARHKNRSIGGYSLFEFIIVITVIGVLAAIGIKYYLQSQEEAQKALINASARSFASSVSSLRGHWLVNRTERGEIHSVDMEGVTVHLNEFGWAASAGESGSPSIHNQTPQECFFLWLGISQSSIDATIQGDENRGRATYHVSMPDSYICRYELAIKNNDTLFFDYNLRNGRVAVSTHFSL
ncbi:type II secretion system protein [Marinibactrum halimedae]|uniref:Prepilin-type N-terminal cleavage/methylation domain-containing protein n=1 Tax=Marinibactrum halimedae TaxID=1444977 RepID=A0AA37T6I5_9GAMM|nr:prepilin-type N-terminal cleavage/methylation domain-containing protein [Marinibactrum halimedae]MCD9460819.1 prepilin-type N-terminal cleavage/methylation domain-containing protein [Marinibactrum halimedae]GLS26716.1 hypothetical protein GCM10007877_24330 [Marinibactrum halimedae]